MAEAEKPKKKAKKSAVKEENPKKVKRAKAKKEAEKKSEEHYDDDEEEDDDEEVDVIREPEKTNATRRKKAAASASSSAFSFNAGFNLIAAVVDPIQQVASGVVSGAGDLVTATGTVILDAAIGSLEFRFNSALAVLSEQPCVSRLSAIINVAVNVLGEFEDCYTKTAQAMSLKLMNFAMFMGDESSGLVSYALRYIEGEQSRRNWSEIDAAEAIGEIYSDESVSRLEDAIDAFVRNARRFAMADAWLHVTITADGQRPRLDDHRKMFLDLDDAIEDFINEGLDALSEYVTSTSPYEPVPVSPTIEEALDLDAAARLTETEEQEYVSILAERVAAMGATGPASIIRQNALRGFWVEQFGDRQVVPLSEFLSAMDDFIADFEGIKALEDSENDYLETGFRALIEKIRVEGSAPTSLPLPAQTGRELARKDAAAKNKKNKQKNAGPVVAVDPALLATFARSVDSNEAELVAVMNILNGDSATGNLRILPPAPSDDIFTFDENKLDDFIDHLTNINLKSKGNGWVSITGARQCGKSSFVLAALHAVDWDIPKDIVYFDLKGATNDAQAVAAVCAQIGLNHISPVDPNIDGFVDEFVGFLGSLKKGSIIVFDNLLADYPSGQLGQNGKMSREWLEVFIQKAIIQAGRIFTYTHCIVVVGSSFISFSEQAFGLTIAIDSSFYDDATSADPENVARSTGADVFIRSLVHSYSDIVYDAGKGRVGVYSVLGRYVSLASLRDFDSLEKVKDKLVDKLTTEESKLVACIPNDNTPFTIAKLYSLCHDAFEDDYAKWYAAYSTLLDKGWFVRDTKPGYVRFTRSPGKQQQQQAAASVGGKSNPNELFDTLTEDELKLAACIPEKIAPPFTIPMLLGISREVFEDDYVRWYAAYFGLLDKGWLVRDSVSSYLRYTHLADTSKVYSAIAGVSGADAAYDRYLLYWASELGRISDQAYQSGSSATMQAYFCTHYPHFEAVTKLFYDPVAEAAAAAAVEAAAKAAAAAAERNAKKKRGGLGGFSASFRRGGGKKEDPAADTDPPTAWVLAKKGDPAGGSGAETALNRSASPKALAKIAGLLAGKLNSFLSANYSPAVGKLFATRILGSLGRASPGTGPAETKPHNEKRALAAADVANQSFREENQNTRFEAAAECRVTVESALSRLPITKAGAVALASREERVSIATRARVMAALYRQLALLGDEEIANDTLNKAAELWVTAYKGKVNDMPLGERIEYEGLKIPIQGGGGSYSRSRGGGEGEGVAKQGGGEGGAEKLLKVRKEDGGEGESSAVDDGGRREAPITAPAAAAPAASPAAAATEQKKKAGIFSGFLKLGLKKENKEEAFTEKGGGGEEPAVQRKEGGGNKKQDKEKEEEEQKEAIRKKNSAEEERISAGGGGGEEGKEEKKEEKTKKRFGFFSGLFKKKNNSKTAEAAGETKGDSSSTTLTAVEPGPRRGNEAAATAGAGSRGADDYVPVNKPLKLATGKPSANAEKSAAEKSSREPLVPPLSPPVVPVQETRGGRRGGGEREREQQQQVEVDEEEEEDALLRRPRKTGARDVGKQEKGQEKEKKRGKKTKKDKGKREA